MERRLTAILVAGVVGASRLMGEDEAGTLTRLKAHREELIESQVAAHQGRIVKLMGDGILVEFVSRYGPLLFHSYYRMLQRRSFGTIFQAQSQIVLARPIHPT